MSKRLLTIALASIALLAGAAALAQVASESSAVQQTLAELRERARLLTLLADVPAEARTGAETLLDRAETLRAAAAELEVTRLEAYIAALENGDSPAVAQSVANAQISEASVDLTRQRETLLADVEAFAEANPGVSRSVLALMRASGSVASGDISVHSNGGWITVRRPAGGAGPSHFFFPGGFSGSGSRGTIQLSVPDLPGR